MHMKPLNLGRLVGKAVRTPSDLVAMRSGASIASTRARQREPLWPWIAVGFGGLAAIAWTAYLTWNAVSLIAGWVTLVFAS